MDDHNKMKPDTGMDLLQDAGIVSDNAVKATPLEASPTAERLEQVCGVPWVEENTTI